MTHQRRRCLDRQKALTERYLMMRTNFDGPEARPLAERCLLAFGSSSGPPMLPVLYNNNYQVVQNKDSVVILVEMVHDARIVRLNGKHGPSSIRKWMGDSIGRWEGDTLVVETANFYEYACHEGNYALPGILAGAREDEKKKPLTRASRDLSQGER